MKRIILKNDKKFSKDTNKLLTKYLITTNTDDLLNLFQRCKENETHPVGDLLIQIVYPNIKKNDKYIKQIIFIYYFLKRYFDCYYFCDKYLEKYEDLEVLKIMLTIKIDIFFINIEDNTLKKIEKLVGITDLIYYYKTIISLRLNNMEEAVQFAYELFFKLSEYNPLYLICLIETSIRSNDFDLLSETLNIIIINKIEFELSRHTNNRARKVIILKLVNVMKKIK